MLICVCVGGNMCRYVQILNIKTRGESLSIFLSITLHSLSLKLELTPLAAVTSSKLQGSTRLGPIQP